MNIVDAIIKLVPVAIASEEGIRSLITLVATLHAAKAITDEQVQKIRDDGGLADALYDLEMKKAKGQ